MKDKDISFLVEEKERHYKEISLKEKKRAKCDHKRHKHGEEVTLLRPTGNGSKAVCSLCGTKVDLEPMNKGELKKAAETLLNALHTIKAAAENPSDELLEALADVQISLANLPDWYETQYLDHLADNSYNNSFDEGENGTMFLNTVGSNPFKLGHDVYKPKKNHKKSGNKKNHGRYDNYNKHHSNRGTNFWDLTNR